MDDQHGAYWEGKIDTELENIKITLDRLEITIANHIIAEKVWQDEMVLQINALRLWRSYVLGLAAGISFLISYIWHLIFKKVGN